VSNLNLIIPVYEGGAYFQECLDSIVPHLDIFDFIIISINKSKNQQNDIDICSAFIKINNKTKFKLFIRNKIYSAKQHGMEIYKDLKKDFDLQNSFIMHLCHDDILLPNFSTNIVSALPKLQKRVTINPAKKRYFENFSDANEFFTYFGLAAYSDGISRDDFLNLDIDRGILMGLSGIITHIDDYYEAWKITKFLIYGWRAEYLMLASKNIIKIHGTIHPLVGIRLHSESQSSLVKRHHIFIDEEIYYIYIHCTTSCKIFRAKNLKRSKMIYFFKHPLICIVRIIYRVTIKQILSEDMHKNFRGYVKKWL
jgi:hypothetical protein